MKKLILLYIILYIAFPLIGQEFTFNDVAADTTRINDILRRYPRSATPGEGMAFVAAPFIDTPYEAGTLEGDAEKLRVNLSAMDCTTFVETVAALAKTGMEGRVSWRDFVYNLTSLRYRHAHIDGYASRLHYFSDWVMDNIHRGNITDATDWFPAATRVVKSLDFMTRNRSAYPALADSLQYERMRTLEGGYRNHSFPHVKASKAMTRDFEEFLRQGDIVAFTTNKPGLDVTHLGIITMVDGLPRLTHASSKKGKVVTETEPLREYLRRNSTWGVRVIRLKQ